MDGKKEWRKYFQDPKMEKEIQKKILFFLMNWGGCLSKKIPFQSQFLFGRLIDPSIWSLLSLEITPIGIYSLSLCHSFELTEISPSNWGISDHFLAYSSWKYLKEKRGETSPFLEKSLFIQLLEFPFANTLQSEEDWLYFLGQGGGLFLIYGENKLMKHWKKYTFDLLNHPPTQAFIELEHLSSLFFFLIDLFQKIGWFHLLFLFSSYFNRTFPNQKAVDDFFSDFPISKNISSNQRLKIEETLEEFISIPFKIYGIFEQITSRSHWDQSCEEQLFVEKYNLLFAI